MKRILAAVVAVSCLAAPLALAQPFMRGNLPPEVAQRAGITPEQQKKIEQMKHDAEQQLIALRAEVQSQRLELKRLMQQTNPDERAVMAQLDKVTHAQGELKKNRVGLMLHVRALVGPDAWQKLKTEMRAQFKWRHHRGMRHRFGGPGQGPMPQDGAPDGAPDGDGSGTPGFDAP